MTAFVDDTRIQIDGRTARVICARNRAGMLSNTALSSEVVPLPIAEGSDQFGAFLRFAPLIGDQSSTDKDRKPPPARAFIALEDMGKVKRYGTRLTQHFGLVVEPGPLVKLGAHCTIAQWNAGPPNGSPWLSPPGEFGIVIVQKLDAAGKAVKNAAGKPIWEEFLELKVHILDAAGKSVVSGRILSDKPLVRGTRYGIGIAFYDGRGGPGRAELWINNRQQGTTWRGPSGYAGYGSVFPAVGSYNHPGQCSPPPAVRIYGWREDPAA